MGETFHSNNSPGENLARFIEERVDPLAKAFAESPLMELRLRTAEGSVTLVKSGATPSAQSPIAVEEKAAAVRRARAPHGPVFPDEEPGRTYDTINADVVGVFRNAPDAPAPGQMIDDDRVIGYIEALKLKYPVRSGGPGLLVAQVAEDGQAVDFAEALFVIDRGAPARTAEELPEEALEPPRL